MCRAVLVDIHCRLKHLEDALLRQCGGEDDGEVGKRRHSVVNGVLESVDGLLALVLHQVPLVDHHHEALVVSLNELEDVHVLRLDATSGVNHEDAHVAVFYGTNGAHHAIKLQVFRHLVLSAYAGGVDEIEVEAELIESRVYAVARGSGYLRDDVAILAEESVYDAGLARVRTAHDGETRKLVLKVVLVVGRQLGDYQVEQVARSATRGGADALRVTQTELVELRGRISHAAVVYLVGHQYHGQLGAAQDLGHVLIPVGHACLNIHEKKHEVGLI